MPLVKRELGAQRNNEQKLAKYELQRPLEIFIKADAPGWEFADAENIWSYKGPFNEKAPMQVLDISVQMIGDDGIERVIDVPDAPFNAKLSGDSMTFTLPSDIDTEKLNGVWFRVARKKGGR